MDGIVRYTCLRLFFRYCSSFDAIPKRNETLKIGFYRLGLMFLVTHAHTPTENCTCIASNVCFGKAMPVRRRTTKKLFNVVKHVHLMLEYIVQSKCQIKSSHISIPSLNSTEEITNIFIKRTLHTTATTIVWNKSKKFEIEGCVFLSSAAAFRANGNAHVES